MRMAIIALFVGQVVASFVGYRFHSDLQTQVAVLQTRIDRLEADRTVTKDALAANERRLAEAEGHARAVQASLSKIDERARL